MKLIPHRQFGPSLGLIIVDGLFFSLTNPKSTPAAALIIGFLLLAVTLYTLIYNLLSFAKLYGMPLQHKNRLAGSLAGLIAVLLALQSMGELNSYDIAVLLPLVIIGYLYSFYGKTSNRSSDS